MKLVEAHGRNFQIAEIFARMNAISLKMRDVQDLHQLAVIAELINAGMGLPAYRI